MTLAGSGLRFGLAIWAAATALFVPFGHFAFGPDNRLPVALMVTLVVAGTFVAVSAFARAVLLRNAATTYEAAALLGVSAALPGLLLDGVLYAIGSGRYPGLDDAASGAMTATLLLAYAVALLAPLNVTRMRRIVKHS
jgi:hypothetical protein